MWSAPRSRWKSQETTWGQKFQGGPGNEFFARPAFPSLLWGVSLWNGFLLVGVLLVVNVSKPTAGGFTTPRIARLRTVGVTTSTTITRRQSLAHCHSSPQRVSSSTVESRQGPKTSHPRVGDAPGEGQDEWLCESYKRPPSLLQTEGHHVGRQGHRLGETSERPCDKEVRMDPFWKLTWCFALQAFSALL